MSKSPYDIFAEPIEQWCKENYYSDFLVTLSIDGHEITQFLEYEVENDVFVWNSDWYEGCDKDIHLLGFIPMGYIHVHGIPSGEVTLTLLDGEE